MKKRAWVIGARGYLGRSLAKKLASTGWEVFGLGRGDFRDHPGWGLLQWTQADVSRETLEGLADTVGSPDLVFHAAGSGTVGASVTDPDKAHSDTVRSAAHVLEFLRDRAPDARFLYPSSCAVYGEAERIPIDEDARIRPVSEYGRHKAEVEILCHAAVDEAGLRCGIIRYFSVYGPGLRKQLLWDVASRLLSGQRELRLGGTGEERRDLLHIDDATDIAIRAGSALTQNTLVVVNGGTGEAVTVRDIVARLAHNLAPDATIRFTGEARGGDPTRFQADVSRLALLGFHAAHRWREGVDEYARWVVASPDPQ